ncbi:MAG: ParB/RepB/Spo0J family partition protein [Clostridiales bacterium]|nr:ParB/RepB/Spo0J family partition protein [Clostridiales bacterium]
MARTKKIGGLGKGLQALIPDMQDLGHGEADPSERQMIPLSRISVNPYQPRRIFDEEKLSELTASIIEHGVIQPVLVRLMDGGYQLVAGERRVRAAGNAGLNEIPALIREMTDHEMMEISLIENIQRQDLDPVEEAIAYKRLSEEFAQTQEQIAQRVSKSRSYIANSIRLLNLPPLILDFLATSRLTIGHVRPLLMLNEEDAVALANRLIDEKATARDAEQWTKEILEHGGEEGSVREAGATGPSTTDGEKGKEAKPLSVELAEIQRILRERINTKVEITQSAKGGKIIIEYYSQDDVERVLEIVTGSKEIN